MNGAATATPRDRARGWAILALVAAALLAAPHDADAARGLTTGLYGWEYTAPVSDTSERDAAFDTVVYANAQVVRMHVVWREIVGDQPPANPRDPADPAYNFAYLDAALRAAAARGLQPFFTLWGAPDWAEGPGRPEDADPGTWKPDPGAYADFGTALATRYSGTYPDPAGGGPLPAVRHYEAWNEPNLPLFLSPQWEGGTPTGVLMFRELLNSFYNAVKAVSKENKVIAPGLAPYGNPPGGLRTQPLTFLENLFCLAGDKKAPKKGGKKGKKKPKGCPKEERSQFDIFSTHPLNLYGGPEEQADVPGDAASGDLPELVRLLRRAEKAKSILPRGRRPHWVTEFWWLTGGVGILPPPVVIPSPDLQARYVAHALYLHWQAGAEVSVHYEIRDELGFPTGLFTNAGEARPAFTAFRFPFVADPQGKNRVFVWGKAPASGQLEIQQEGANGWETVKSLSVTDGAVFTTKLKLSGPATLRAAGRGGRKRPLGTLGSTARPASEEVEQQLADLLDWWRGGHRRYGFGHRTLFISALSSGFSDISPSRAITNRPIALRSRGPAAVGDEQEAVVVPARTRPLGGDRVTLLGDTSHSVRDGAWKPIDPGARTLGDLLDCGGGAHPRARPPRQPALTNPRA